MCGVGYFLSNLTGDSSDNDAALCTGGDDLDDHEEKGDEDKPEVNEIAARQVTADVIRQHIANGECDN